MVRICELAKLTLLGKKEAVLGKLAPEWEKASHKDMAQSAAGGEGMCFKWKNIFSYCLVAIKADELINFNFSLHIKK